MPQKTEKIKEALLILTSIEIPRGQRNDRSALCLLALLNMTTDKAWADAENPLVGITPMMEFSKRYYGREYAPNTRETFRRFTMHQFCEAGLARYNPDKPDRPTNSPKTVYQISPEALELIKKFDSQEWESALKHYLAIIKPLAQVYANERNQQKIPVRIAPGKEVKISPGEHSELIKKIVEDFAPRFAPGAALVYVGDTEEKWGYFNAKLLSDLGVEVESHGKMPDVVLYYAEKNWLLLVESVTSHGPVDHKRHLELARLFSGAKPGLVFVSAFPSHSVMGKYLSEISWETEVWIADNPSHMIHFNGPRFLGPYGD